MNNESKIYKIVQDQKNSDASAWAFIDKDRFEQIYFKFPDLKNDEVRIRILSTGLCASDYLYGRGQWGKKQYPIVTGHEVVGEIDIIGQDVIDFQIGDKVMIGPLRNFCNNCQLCKEKKTNVCQGIEYNEKKLYGKYWGGYSTHIQLPQKMIFKLPDGLDINTIPPLMCAGITTFTPLNKFLKKGQKIAVIGCGGLGHFAIQWGKKMGGIVDVFSSSNKKNEIIKKLGGNNVIIWTNKEHEQLQNEYDIIINTLACDLDQQGSIVWDSFLKCLKPYGIFIQVGVPNFQSKMIFTPSLLIQKMITIYGQFIGGIKDYQDMFEFVKVNGIECISEVFQWNEFPKALNRLENENPIFRCVVNVDNESIKYKKKQQIIFI